MEEVTTTTAVSISDVFTVEAMSNRNITAVDGRMLWEYLGMNMNNIGRDLNKAIDDALLDEGVDYSIYHSSILKGGKKKGGIGRTEWVFTANAAKEIAMMSNQVKGKEIRKYFIEVEKKSSEAPVVLTMDMLIEQYQSDQIVIAEQTEVIEDLSESLSVMEDTDTVLRFEEVAKILNIGKNTLIKELRDNGVMTRSNLPKQQYMQYFEVKYVPFTTDWGYSKVNTIVSVTIKGLSWIKTNLDKK